MVPRRFFPNESPTGLNGRPEGGLMVRRAESAVEGVEVPMEKETS